MYIHHRKSLLLTVVYVCYVFHYLYEREMKSKCQLTINWMIHVIGNAIQIYLTDTLYVTSYVMYLYSVF